MDTLHYNTGEMILTINNPIDESGQYCIETEDDTELGHLFVDGADAIDNRLIWKGTTEEVNQIAAELGEFIESATL